MKKQRSAPSAATAQRDVSALLLAVLITVLSDEFPNLKMRMLERLLRIQRAPENAKQAALIEKAICFVEDCR